MDQSEYSVLGYHSDEAGIEASVDRPVVTFANHTCEMRLMREPFSVIQNVFPKVGVENVCTTEFLYYLTKGRIWPSDYKGHHPEYREAWVAVPPLDRQRRIVDVLAPLDELIEGNDRRISVAFELLQLAYRELLRRGGVSWSPDGPTLARDSPFGWRIGTVREIAERIKVPYDPANSEDLPLLDLARIPGHSHHIRAVGRPDELTSSRIVFREGMTLVGLIRPNLQKGVLAPFDGVTNTSVLVATAVPSIPAAYVHAVLTSVEWWEWAVLHASGTKMPVLSWADIADMPVVVPRDGELVGFADAASAALDAIRVLNRQNLNLRALRGLVLPPLVLGQLEPPSNGHPLDSGAATNMRHSDLLETPTVTAS